MWKVFKYTVFDLLRSKWTLIYFAFYAAITSALLFFSGSLSKTILSLLNIVLLLSPLVGTLFGVTYYYGARDFILFLLAQPLPRTHIIGGQIGGLVVSLSAGLLLGIGLPFLYYGLFASAEIFNFAMLLVVGFFLTAIFTILAYLIGLRNDNRIRGFGMAILVWLLMAVIYDGFFLLVLFWFRDYPLEKAALALSFVNPIDLSRILLLLKLDVAALLGYTGAVFQSFFGTGRGILLSLAALVAWTAVPFWWTLRTARRKDF